MDQWDAAKRGDLDRLMEVVTLENVDLFDWCGDTCLSYASKHCRIECVLWLLEERMANVNLFCDSAAQWNALHCAAVKGDPQICHILISHGADVDARVVYQTGHRFNTPLEVAIKYAHTDCVYILIDAGAKTNKIVVPNWVNTLVESRKACRRTATILMGLYKYKRTTFGGNNRDVMRLVACAIWETRMNNRWQLVKAK
jgi:hypothetical protein